MGAQHAPQTAPLWRRFLSLPRTRLGWWAVGLAGIASIAFVMAFTLPDPEDSVSPPWWNVALEPITFITVLVAPLAGGVVGSLAVGAGDSSLLVWFAQVPAAIFFVGLCSIFEEKPPWVGISAGVLFWAVIAFGIIYLRSQGNTRGHEPSLLSKSQRELEKPLASSTSKGARRGRQGSQDNTPGKQVSAYLGS